MNALLETLMVFSLNTFASPCVRSGVKTFCQNLNIILLKTQIHRYNIVNHQTTRTVEGDHFKRKIVTNCKDGQCKVNPSSQKR